MHKSLRASLFVAAIAAASPAFAVTVGTAEGDASGTAVSLDQDPVITEILNAPGSATVDGHAFSSSNWNFLASDGTGSISVFSSKTTLTTNLGYTPTVGDAITISGKV